MRWLPLLFLLAGAARAATVAEQFHDEARPLLEKYCLDCHEGAKAKGSTDLAQFDAAATLWRNPKLWERALTQLQDRVMPPARKTQPADPERARLVAWLQEALQHPEVALLPQDPGPALVRRLSRGEYNLTVRDLFGVESRPADLFPADAGGGAGFDNNASTLFVPPLLLEKFLAAAETVSAAAKPELLFPAGPEAAPRENIARLAARAFRQPPAPAAVERLLALYETALARGEQPPAAMRLVAKAMLVSPQFLFRTEAARAGATEPYEVDDYALASRLSYFLWSSMPDAELLALAAAGTLHEPAVLETQTRRLLADSKAHAFAENFASQWLRTKELRTSVAPAPDKFPQWTPELREALYEEPVSFFQALLRENLPLTDCLDARYTFANATSAKFYGLPEVAGAELRRVELSDPARGGVLGMGGVLALTSYPRRTSPVLRGKWVMEEILGTPPPPPPADVNTAAVEHRDSAQTLRQRLEQHRADPKCAGCHARMDPLGFGLENYNAIGTWRTEIDKAPVDSSGQLVNGTKFNGPAELKALLRRDHQQEFIRNITEKTLAYALGRGLEPADWWPVQEIARAVAADGCRTQTLILGVVQSYPFRYRRPPAAVAATP